MSLTAYANETKIKNFLYFSDHCFPSNTKSNNSNLVLELLPFFSFLSWKPVSSAEKKILLLIQISSLYIAFVKY